MIFSGVIGCATELPGPDIEVLSAGITALGGQWRTGLTKDVTHLFTITSTSHKYATALHFQEHTKIKVLLPHWFDDVVRLGMRGLDTSPYEWPDPVILRADPMGIGDVKRDSQKLDGQKKSLFKTALMSFDGDDDGESKGIDEDAQDPVANEVWLGRKIVLSLGLGLREQMREAVAVGIRRAKGVVLLPGSKEEELEMVGRCNVLVTRYRSGRAYVKVSFGPFSVVS